MPTTFSDDDIMEPGFEGNAIAQDRFTRAPTFLARKEIPEIDLQQPGTGMTSMNNEPPLPEAMQTLSPRVRGTVPQNKGAMYVVPGDSMFETNRVARHEAVHNLLGQAGINDAELQAFHSKPSVKPLFDQISSAYGEGNMGAANSEIPAYLVASPKYLQVDPAVRKQYLNKLVNFVRSKNLKWGQTLKRMIPSDQLPGQETLDIPSQ
jgi:hypothetical protein